MKAFGLWIALLFLSQPFTLEAQSESERYEMGLMALKEGKYTEAKKVFYQLRSQYPQNSQYWYLSGMSKIQLKD